MKRFLFLCIASLLVLAACDTNGSLQETSPTATLEQSTADAQTARPDLELRVEDALAARAAEDDPKANAQAFIALMNEQLAEDGLNVAIQKVEWVGGGDSHEAGQTVFANDRQLRLESQWVPGDERRNADGDKLTHVVDQTFAFANASIDAEPAIDASFDTWNDVTCSKLSVVKLPDGDNTNYSAILGTGEPTDVFYADISTIGFLPGGLFDLFLGPGASENVLGVTFTFVFIDDEGNPTDINDDGYTDVALAEVWYNDAFTWSTDGSATDIETVALHENGHALGLGHFGKVFVTENNNKLHVAPRAAMNAFILGTLREPLGTDNSAYCGLYASWDK